MTRCVCLEGFERALLVSSKERIASSIAHPGCRWRDALSSFSVVFVLSSPRLIFGLFLLAFVLLSGLYPRINRH